MENLTTQSNLVPCVIANIPSYNGTPKSLSLDVNRCAR